MYRSPGGTPIREKRNDDAAFDLAAAIKKKFATVNAARTKSRRRSNDSWEEA